MKISKIVAGVLSLCIMFTGEIMASSNSLSVYSIDKDKLPDISLPTIDWDAVNEQSYEFTLKSDGTYEISEYIYQKPDSGFYAVDITIPSSYKGKPVTSIGERAFAIYNAYHITGTITIPSSITSIGELAFSMCNFTNCIIPSSVTSIGSKAFKETPWLDNMRKQNSLVIINNILIDAQNAAGDVVIPNGVTDISGYAFSRNTNVTSVTLPNSVKTIGNCAFEVCESLEKINIPNTVTEIGAFAFDRCKKLSGTITIPGSVKTISSWAFANCTSLTNIVMQNGVINIGINAFRNCSSVTSVTIPNTVQTIENGAFSEEHKLTNIVIPESVKSIGRSCFEYCYKLKAVTIQNPKCEIYDTSNTIYSPADIYGYESSTAKSYAEKYNRKFVALDRTIKLGDVNFDGVVDGIDATLVLREYTMIISGDSETFSDNQKLAANVNGDESVDGIDATLILRYYTEALSLTSGTMPDMETWIKTH
ncbi:MAG: leucine-rich repeat protein [Ruminococcus flavefaciens]|nr:leucine-rich repeat protein [Ruminococcus flavefaciens]MCM1058977.1 leucine-rich repeat protein [Eubacterium sp.]